MKKNGETGLGVHNAPAMRMAVRTGGDSLVISVQVQQFRMFTSESTPKYGRDHDIDTLAL